MGPERPQGLNPCNLNDDEDDDDNDDWWWLMILYHCFLKPNLLKVHVVFRNEALVTELWQYIPFKSDVFKMLSYWYSAKTSYHSATKCGVKEMSGFWIGL